MTDVHLEITPRAASVAVGQTVRFGLLVANVTDTIDAYAIRVFGLDPAWVVLSPPRVSLFPGDVAVVDLAIQLPPTYSAGHRELSVHVQSENDPADFITAPIGLDVHSQPNVGIAVDPVSIVGGSTAQFGLVLHNRGNSTVHAVPDGIDPEEKTLFAFVPPAVALLPGEQEVVRAEVKSKRPWFGQPVPRVLTFGVESPERSEAIGTFVQKPRIGRWLLSLIGLIAAAAVFAAVLNRAFDNVVDRASVSDEVLNEALASGDEAGQTVSVNPASITGFVRSQSSGEPVAGVQAELFNADNGTVAIASAATDANGRFAFSRLDGATYRVRFSGAGFSETWYERGRVFAEAVDVEVEAGKPFEMGTIFLGGEPAVVGGRVIAEDPTGATATLFLAEPPDPAVPTEVLSVDVSADGSFVFESVPSPADYELVIQRVGSATERRSVIVSAGDVIDDLEIRLRPDDGAITGRIFADNAPLGGVLVVADDGSNRVETVSITDGDVGFFALRGLATPGRYTITVSRDEYSSETRSVSLDEGQSLEDLTFTLSRAVGSLGGTVRGTDGSALGGVTVSVTGADLSISTTTLSQGAGAGTWFVDDLPVPGTYTITFSREGLLSQVRLVDLDPSTGSITVGNVDATLTAATGVILGEVVDAEGRGIPRADVILTNGVDTWNLRTSDEPEPGDFRVENLPPGPYTLTVERIGAVPVVRLVNIAPGQLREERIQLSDQASITGRVLLINDQGAFEPYEGAIVRLYTPSEFPSGDFVDEFIVGADGRYEFLAVSAPDDFVVAVRAVATGSVLDSELVESVPGEQLELPDFEIRTID